MILKNGGFKLKDSVYNILKWICLICLPACSVLYFALAKIWNLPYEAEIPATINAIAVFIGSLIGISQIQINRENQDADI